MLKKKVWRQHWLELVWMRSGVCILVPTLLMVKLARKMVQFNLVTVSGQHQTHHHHVHINYFSVLMLRSWEWGTRSQRIVVWCWVSWIRYPVVTWEASLDRTSTYWLSSLHLVSTLTYLPCSALINRETPVSDQK